MANKTGRDAYINASDGTPIDESFVDLGSGLYARAAATPDGASPALGAKADSAATTDAGTFSLIALFKRLLEKFTAGIGLTAGESHIGEVGGNSTIITPSITVDTAAYSAGDTVGGKITLTNALRAAGHNAVLQSIHILDRSNQKPTGSILIFNADPTAATTTDNQAFVYSTDDLKEIARIPVATADYATINSKAVANLSNLGRVLSAASGTSLYTVFVTDGAPDFVAGTDLQIMFGLLRD
jgi:hypothetical protein